MSVRRPSKKTRLSALIEDLSQEHLERLGDRPPDLAPSNIRLQVRCRRCGEQLGLVMFVESPGALVWAPKHDLNFRLLVGNTTVVVRCPGHHIVEITEGELRAHADQARRSGNPKTIRR